MATGHILCAVKVSASGELLWSAPVALADGPVSVRRESVGRYKVQAPASDYATALLSLDPPRSLNEVDTIIVQVDRTTWRIAFDALEVRWDHVFDLEGETYESYDVPVILSHTPCDSAFSLVLLMPTREVTR